MFLQEVWTPEYVKLLSDAGADAGLTHITTFDGGVFGAGLMLMSRYPITDLAFRTFSVRGEPGALEGEAMAGEVGGGGGKRLDAGEERAEGLKALVARG